MAAMPDTGELERVAQTALAGLHYDLVALEWTRGPNGWVVRVYIDRPEGGSVSLDDCARASRDLSAALDVADLIHQQYSLEVSSPGLDRPLARASDFTRFTGRRARVRLKEGVDGRRNFSGTLRGVDGGEVQIECDGRLFKLPLADVVKANLEVEL
jgi:ribosome maturation factor RimP